MILERNGAPGAEQREWHALNTEEVLDHLKVEGNGLTSEEAKKRLELYGPNQLREAPRRRSISRAQKTRRAGCAGHPRWT